MKRLIVVLFFLLPRLVAGQGSIGNWEQLWTGFGDRFVGLNDLIRTEGKTFFVTGVFWSHTLWATDGTEPGTFRLENIGKPPERVDGTDHEVRLWSTQGPRVFFTRPGYPEGQDPIRELWRSDGTVESTVPLAADLSFAIDASRGDAPTSLAVPELGLMFFSAGEEGDYELWATDGTAAGTRLVKDVNPAGPSRPSFMATLGGELFFLADLPAGKELWRSDGTPEGTERVDSLGTGKFTLVRAGEELFLLDEKAAGTDLLRTGGTELSLALSLPSPLLAYAVAGPRLFLAVGGSQARELWVAKGDFTAPFRVLETTGPGLDRLWAAGDDVVFSLSEIWLSDGTAAGTRRLGDFCLQDCNDVLRWAGKVNGWLVLLIRGVYWLTDGTGDNVFPFLKLSGYYPSLPYPFFDRLLVPWSAPFFPTPTLSSLEVNMPFPPAGDWLESPRVPGFRFKVRIGQTVGRQEPSCPARTLCVGGVVPGRSDVFLQATGTKPAAVKLTPAPVEVWMHQTSTGFVRYHRLDNAGPASPILPGVLDRDFFPLPVVAPVSEEAVTPRPPSGPWVSYPSIKGFRVKARIAGRTLRAEQPCAPGIFCLAAVKGQPDLLVRITGKQANGYQWPMLARFTPARTEVWIEQSKTGTVRYYVLDAVPAGSLALDGLVDRQGFRKSAPR